LSTDDLKQPSCDLGRIAVGHTQRMFGDGSICLSLDGRFSLTGWIKRAIRMKTKNHVLIITAVVLLLTGTVGTAASGDEQGSLSKITFYVA
jgi:hypothetical protein